MERGKTTEHNEQRVQASRRRLLRQPEEAFDRRRGDMQCVQRADTCSAMHWCALLSAGAYVSQYGWLGVLPVTRGESRASADGAAIFLGYPTAAAKNLLTIVVPWT